MNRPIPLMDKPFDGLFEKRGGMLAPPVPSSRPSPRGPWPGRAGRLIGGPVGGVAARELGKALAPKTQEQIEEEAYEEIVDPVQEAELAKIRTQAMLAEFLSTDPVISTYDPDEVTDAYNQVVQMTPRAALQPAVMRGLLRRYLQQSDAMEPHEAEQMARLEKTLKGIQEPAKLPLAPRFETPRQPGQRKEPHEAERTARLEKTLKGIQEPAKLPPAPRFETPRQPGQRKAAALDSDLPRRPGVTREDLREMAGQPVEQPGAPAAPRMSPEIRRALKTGLVGAVAGGGLGALRAGLYGGKDKQYLRDTLAGMLIGGLGAGATSYLSGTDPFTRGSAPAKSFAKARETFLRSALTEPGASPAELAGRSAMTGLAEYLSGKHEFTPEQQEALVRQFIKARVPTTRGWRRRVNLAAQAATALQAAPAEAAHRLVTLQKVAPDPEMRTYAGEALARLRSGEAVTPEGRHALASLGKEMEARLGIYRKATKVLDAINIMKELYGTGALTKEQVAKNIGLITGRFGKQTPQAEELRGFVRQVLAKPVLLQSKAPYTQAMASELGPMVQRILAQRSAA